MGIQDQHAQADETLQHTMPDAAETTAQVNATTNQPTEVVDTLDVLQLGRSRHVVEGRLTDVGYKFDPLTQDYDDWRRTLLDDLEDLRGGVYHRQLLGKLTFADCSTPTQQQEFATRDGQLVKLLIRQYGESEFGDFLRDLPRQSAEEMARDGAAPDTHGATAALAQGLRETPSRAARRRRRWRSPSQHPRRSSPRRT